jgi:hypothetical protein
MSSNNSYEKKYLKYKLKYFELSKNGGGIFSTIKKAAPSASTLKSFAKKGVAVASHPVSQAVIGTVLTQQVAQHPIAQQVAQQVSQHPIVKQVAQPVAQLNRHTKLVKLWTQLTPQYQDKLIQDMERELSLHKLPLDNKYNPAITHPATVNMN